MVEPTVVNTSDIDRMIRQVKELENIDFSPLMEEWRGILEYDNENNLGVDGYGVPMDDVTYRPVEPKLGTGATYEKFRPLKPIDYSILKWNNLTGSHYRTLEGPPLSPRGEDSRVTKTFRTRWEKDEPQEGDWTTYGTWEDFLSLDDLEILPFHAEGPEHNPNLPVRDLLHIRPTALMKARDALARFINRLLGKAS